MLLGLAKSELCRRKASRNEVASVTIAREVTPTPAAPPTAEGGSEGASTMEATVQPAMQVSAQPARSRPALRKQSCSLSTDAFALVLAKKTNEGSATQGISGTIERGAAFFSPHLSSTRRHNIGVLLRSNQFRTHSTAFALTGTETQTRHKQPFVVPWICLSVRLFHAVRHAIERALHSRMLPQTSLCLLSSSAQFLQSRRSPRLSATRASARTAYGDGQRTPGHWPPPRRQHAKQSFASA